MTATTNHTNAIGTTQRNAKASYLLRKERDRTSNEKCLQYQTKKHQKTPQNTFFFLRKPVLANSSIASTALSRPRSSCKMVFILRVCSVNWKIGNKQPRRGNQRIGSRLQKRQTNAHPNSHNCGGIFKLVIELSETNLRITHKRVQYKLYRPDPLFWRGPRWVSP
jgi:hypothetical protein